MKKLYSFFAAVVIAATVQAQTIKTVTISVANIGGTSVLKTTNYDGGAERLWTTDGISFGGKAITTNNANSPVNGTAGGTLIQAQATNGVIYNTTPLPGKIISVTINSVGTAQNSSLYGGTSRLVNSTAADYSVTGGTQVGSASTSGWTSADLAGTDYNFFAVKRGASAAYISSIVIEYLDPTPVLAVKDSNAFKSQLVKNTLVDNELVFGAKAEARIFNLNGQVLRSVAANIGTSVDMSSLPKGIYIVSGNVEGKAVSQKIIKK